MLDYNEVKKFYANKLAQDLDGTGRIESAFYHTMKMVYLKGVEDGKRANGGDLGQIGIADGKKEVGDVSHDNA